MAQVVHLHTYIPFANNKQTYGHGAAWDIVPLSMSRDMND